MQGTKRSFILVAILLLPPFLCDSEGQRSAAYTLGQEHHEALELFDKEKYAAAQAAFDRVAEKHSSNDLIAIAARYYSARCAMELYNRDAEEKMTEFVEHYPDSPWLTQAYYQLGRYHYQKHRYDRAIENFATLDTSDLEEGRRHEVAFKKGHAHFKEGDFEKADQAFYSIKDQEQDYYGPANYYFAHIAYRRKNYQTALEHFQRIEDHPNFKGIIPYYLTQIHYLLENYDTVIQMAPPFLDSAGTERPKEIARIIGESFYAKERYEESIPYLERYIKNAYGVNREDRYQMGYALMKAGKHEQALDHFEKVVEKEDSLAQAAYYHVGTIQIEEGAKRKAQSAYRSASRFDMNERIREDALFQFAKLSYELSYDPFDQAIGALRTYIEEYPNSDRKEEALEYLSRLYMSSRDRDAALASMERIDEKNNRIKTAYQVVAYDKGVNLFLEGRYAKAIKVFQKSRTYQMDRDLTAKSLYWEARSNSELDRTEKALKTFEEFRREPGAFELPFYERSYYDAGYVYFNDSSYKEAATEFRKFTDAVDPKEKPSEVADAHQRTGDAYYLIKDYDRALRFYRKASGIKEGGARDRALYQSAICLGLMEELDQKIASLEKLLEEVPSSSFKAQAELELGRALVKKDDKDRALARFRSLIDKRPESFEAQKARLQAGLILYQRGDNEKALSRFKEVVESGSGPEISREAMNRIRNIHVETGNMEAFNEYAENVEGFEVEEKEMDEANYRSAENSFTQGNYEKAARSFKKYLEAFDPPQYAINARFYRAKSLLRIQDSAKALQSFIEVLSDGPNRFTLPALEEGASLAHDLDSLPRALDLYRRLEERSNSGSRTLQALTGQMRVLKALSKDSLAYEAADKVLRHPETNDKLRVEALMIQGRYLQEGAKDLKAARELFQRVIDTTSSIAKAEARHRIAKSYFQERDLEKTEEQIYKLVHQKPSYKEWVAKGFLLLSDVYREKGDRFQAKETLKSLIDSYDGEAIVKKAKKSLVEIRKAEREAEEEEERSKKDTNDMEIRLEPDTTEER